MLQKHHLNNALNIILSQPNFAECYKIAKEASKGGKLYLAGGKLYRSLVEVIYGQDVSARTCDFDFVTTAMSRLDIKNGWKINEKKGKAPYVDETGQKRSTRLISETYGAELDIVFIPTIMQVKEGKLPNSIDGYLKSVPLNIQSIALDLDTAELIGDKGIEAIYSGKVKVNNIESLKAYCSFKRISEISYLRNKADSIYFTAILEGLNEDSSYNDAAFVLKTYPGTIWADDSFGTDFTITTTNF